MRFLCRHWSSRRLLATHSGLHFSSFDCSSGVLEPIDDVVDIQGSSASSRFQRIQFPHVFLNLKSYIFNATVLGTGELACHLLSCRMVIFGEPFLQFRNFCFRIKANPHPWLGHLKLFRCCSCSRRIWHQWRRNSQGAISTKVMGSTCRGR